LGAHVLRAVLGCGKEAATTLIDRMDLAAARVFAEVPLGKVADSGNTLDLLIESNAYYVFIEHKINSREAGLNSKREEKQTVRYSNAIRDNWPIIRSYCQLPGACPAPDDARTLKLFLTPDGTKATDLQWRPITHEEIIQACLGVLHDKQIGKRARYNLCCFLWDLITGPLLQDETIVDELRHRVECVYAELTRGENRGASQWFALEQWCATNNCDLGTIIGLLEGCDG